MRVGLVPFKGLLSPKSRLSPVLSLSQRQSLAIAMLEDVLSALQRSSGLDRIALVSRDQEASKLAIGYGCVVVGEDDVRGESEAVDLACSELKKRGVLSVLVIPGDVPLVTPDEIARIIALEDDESSGVMVPSLSGDGTNALLRKPPDSFPACFGEGSFDRHKVEAQKRGISLREVTLPGLALDIDTPGDLRLFVEHRKRGHAYDVLEELDLLSRLGTTSKVPEEN